MHAERTQHPLCLDEERSALTGRDLAALEKTTREKVQHTQSLEQLEQQREKLVAELGFATDSSGQRRCFDSLPQADNLNSLWQRVLANVEACQTGNLTNGGILELGRQQVEQALGILRGQSNRPALYDPHGETATDLGRRELGKV
jgi:flagellar biosynthesis/type III secretory pathway chaperone